VISTARTLETGDFIKAYYELKETAHVGRALAFNTGDLRGRGLNQIRRASRGTTKTGVPPPSGAAGRVPKNERLHVTLCPSAEPATVSVS